MKLDVTESAVSHLKNVLAQSVDGKGIRLATKASGCSGYAYVLEYAKHSVEDDLVLSFNGLEIFIDSLSVPLLDGTLIDLVQDGLNKSLKFSNPNVVSECGCGESFAVGNSLPL